MYKKHGLMVPTMKDNGQTISYRERESLLQKMGRFTMEIGLTTKNTVMEQKHGNAEDVIKANTNKE